MLFAATSCVKAFWALEVAEAKALALASCGKTRQTLRLQEVISVGEPLFIGGDSLCTYKFCL